MEAERTRLVVNLVQHPTMEPTDTFFVVIDDEALAIEDIQSAIAEWSERPGGEPELWEIYEHKNYFNWGASGTVLDYVVQVFNDGTAELFWTAFGMWLQRRLEGRPPASLPDEEAASNRARLSILTAYPSEKWQDLVATSSEWNRDTGTRAFEIESPTHTYEVEVRKVGGLHDVVRFRRSRKH
jgi:hypothetical protein